MTSFAFLKAEWPDVFEAAAKAESLVIPDPRTACFYARRALELAVAWAYKSDAALKLPYQDNISALIHEPSFKNRVGRPSTSLRHWKPHCDSATRSCPRFSAKIGR
jgi:type I restriction enzyme R subunit